MLESKKDAQHFIKETPNFKKEWELYSACNYTK